MTYRVAIRNNTTGETRIHVDSFDWDDAADYLWTEGNFCCDCNRALLFARAGGDPDPKCRQCGHDAFSALYVELPSGERIELEGD
jgi:hypothetical protein